MNSFDIFREMERETDAGNITHSQKNFSKTVELQFISIFVCFKEHRALWFEPQKTIASFSLKKQTLKANRPYIRE